MAYNLSRNSKVFLTTNLNTATGKVLTSGFNTGNTFELKVLDGFKFSQDTAQTTISINEAGNTPIRGQRAFNTAVNPVDISFSTYLRPRFASVTTTADEKHLWNALFGFVGTDGTSFNENGALVTNTPITVVATQLNRANTATGTVTMAGATLTGASVGTFYNIKNLTIANAAAWEGPAKLMSYSGGVAVWQYATPPVGTAGSTLTGAISVGKIDRAAWSDYTTNAGRATAVGQVSSAMSNRNQLLPIGFIFIVDNVSYVIHNAAMDGVTVDFGLDQIAMAAWTAKGTELEQLASNITITGGATMTGGVSGTFQVAAADSAPYITNKLSTMTLQSNLYGSDYAGSTAYSVVLTGGSIQIANNITYVTPANLGQVNKAIGYFTGARAISGSVNAYLRTGSTTVNDAGALLKTMLANLSTSVETKYKLQVELGGSSNGVRVEFEMPGAVISVPSVDIQDVVSTAINFNAQAAASDVGSQTYDIENTNDLTVRYYSNAS